MKLAKNIRVSFQHIVRAAFRSLIRAPRFSVIVLILLSFAIVINLAAYDLVDAVYSRQCRTQMLLGLSRFGKLVSRLDNSKGRSPRALSLIGSATQDR